jgi:hypothetical protein
LNIAFHETAQGRIELPDTVKPKDIEGILNELPTDDPKAKPLVERIQRIRHELGL